MSEQFCLRWNNHQSTLISVFENLLESESLIDCTLCAEGQILKAHKVVLSACSPTFETMLCIQEEKHPIIFLKDVRFIELKAMIDYMYKGEVNILQDQLDSFLKTAAALQIKGLTDQGGGGGDEPPAKKGPGRKTGMSDVAPESPLVGNAPLREGSMSPTRRRRRLPRRPSSAEDGSADNSSCDIPPPAVAAPPSVAAQPAPLPASEPSPRLTVKKQEPLDPPLITPKQEQLDEPAEDIEDLTLDDDDDYNDAMSEMSKPGTSFGAMGPGNTSQDFSQWQQMMSGNQAGTDEVFMAAQEAINNQTNTQGSRKRSPKFTYEEKSTLLNILTNYHNLVDSSATTVTGGAFWDNVETSFNLKNYTPHFRCKKMLRKLYDNLKTAVRQKLKHGGSLCPMDKKVKELMESGIGSDKFHDVPD